MSGPDEWDKETTMVDTSEPLYAPANGSPTDLVEVYRTAVARMSVDAKAAARGEEDALDRAAKWASVAIAADRWRRERT